VVLAALVATALGGWASPARAVTFRLFPTSVAPGGTVNFTGDGCSFAPSPFPRGPSLTISPGIDGLVAHVDTNASTGVFTGRLELPASTPAGTYTVSARCIRSGGTIVYPPATFTVTGPLGTSTTVTTLPPPTTPTTMATTTTTTPTTPTSPSHCAQLVEDSRRRMNADLDAFAQRLAASLSGDRLASALASLDAQRRDAEASFDRALLLCR
jgi:hypothetical protein